MASLANPKPGLIGRLAAAIRALTPGPRAWRGAGWGALVALAMILLVSAYGLFGHASSARFLLGAILFLGAFALIGALLALVWRLLARLPGFYVWVLASAVPAFALLVLTATSVSIGIIVVGFGTLAVASLLGAAVAALTGGRWGSLTHAQRIMGSGGLALGLAGLVVGGFWLLDPGSPPAHPPAPTGAEVQVAPLAMPDPSEAGPHTVHTLFYGSGEDRHRDEYGAGVDLVTEPVDGSALVTGWSGLRTAYWGFGPGALPLNGRVWFPDTDQPAPLVLILHGQHPMEDFSDPGYAYLGELLASRGFIAVSVDENFLNLSPLTDLVIVQSLVEENDLRGWLLLEHLQAWRRWNEAPDNPFFQRVDLDRIALIGHSRGGEAIAIAAAFNRLPHYPDNASVRFEYGFGIRSLVGLAPVEGTYRPAGQDLALENVNYLVLHGAHDMDVFTFQGDRQYARVRFTGGDWFKSALYIYGANHGQFNTVWGREDLFEPIMRVYNLEQLMPGEEQRQIARVTISAFLEATLRGEAGYRPLFQDIRRGGTWLPETAYLLQYGDAHTQRIATYEEDIDLTSMTMPGGRTTGENLTLWREGRPAAKWESLGDQAVYLGWDAATEKGPAVYQIDLPAGGLTLTDQSVLVFSMADANLDPTSGERARTDRREPIDLTLEVVDAAGEVARLPLSHFSPLQPQLQGRLGKAGFMSPLPVSEAVLHHFEFRLADFSTVNPGFDPARLAWIGFFFDRTEAGVVVLDNVGIRN